MSDRHTPGPWRLRKGMLDKSGAELFISGRDWAEFASVYVRKEGKDEFDPEGMANARLIAAAPDLLDAAILALDTCEYSHVRKALREAIAKVEGGE